IRHVLLTAEAQKTPIWEISIRRQSGVYHGSGCLFSATLAAHLARGESSATAAAAAQKTVQQAIRQAVAVPSLGRQKLLIN
ncbi:MAG: hydroxymethylpyrimidine/phosphomethylpyrimidine kinase, partial [Proteobacteria bacterium]|nr:hydroxymethylpyrimidine/phosphomethylpyrimidine kinase [Pseudomonadota bacterium]